MVVSKDLPSKFAWRATWKSKMAAIFQDGRQILFDMSNFSHLQYSKAFEISKNESGILRNI